MQIYTDKADIDPIVKVQRSEVLDEAACRYCREILDEKIVDILSPDYEEFFLVEPHFGCRGVNIFIRKSEREFSPEIEAEYAFKRPTKNQTDNWTKEK